MTDSLTRTLVRYGDKALIDRYLPALTAGDLDALAQGAMFMTEQAAGSDVGAATTTALRDGDAWRLYGDKWFCSNADAGQIGRAHVRTPVTNAQLVCRILL